MKLFSDKLFYQYAIFMFIFIIVSRTVLSACSWSFRDQNWLCSVFIIISYALLMYVCSMSIKETENSKDEEVKLTRYFINGIIMLILVLTIGFNIYDIVNFIKFSKKAVKKVGK